MPIMQDAKTILIELEGEMASRIGKQRIKAMREALEQDWSE
jgi:hypothetical protein